MILRMIKKAGLIVGSLAIVLSCSTGSDPDPVLDDQFGGTAKKALIFEDIITDLGMHINAIAMNSLNASSISDNVDCFEATVHRTGATLDSIVYNYGTSACSFFGGSFVGKVTIDPVDANLKKFKIRLKDFSSQTYTITSKNIDFEVVGDAAGKSFKFNCTDLNFVKSLSDSKTETYSLSSVKNVYTFSKDEATNTEEQKKVNDDTYTFTSQIIGKDPSNVIFTLNTTKDCIYSFYNKCNKMIGGKADFTYNSSDAAVIDFGAGSPIDNCDNQFVISFEGIEENISI